MTHMRSIISMLLLLATAGPIWAGPAKEPHGDILISILDGQLFTSLIAEDKRFTIPGVRVFGAELGETGVPFFFDEPGIQIEDGTFTPFATLGFDILAPLGRWNGDGFDALDPVLDEAMTISFASGALSATTGAGFVPGFSIETDSKGGLHEHYDFLLAGSGAEPLAGIYLLELGFTTKMRGVAGSDSVWIVFNHGLSEREHDLAIDYVQMHLVPAPSALPFLIVAAAFTCRRRR